MSGSLDRPRPFPDSFHFANLIRSTLLCLALLSPSTTSTSCLLTFRPFRFGSLCVPSVKMAIPEADPDEPQVTKPFKFVTGEFHHAFGLPSFPLILWAQWP